MTLYVALIVLPPTVKGVAKPPDEIVATAVFELVQDASDVQFVVLESDQWQVAVNCCVDPMPTVTGDGVTTILDTVGAVNVPCQLAIAEGL